jgi:hypothetical protein
VVDDAGSDGARMRKGYSSVAAVGGRASVVGWNGKSGGRGLFGGDGGWVG